MASRADVQRERTAWSGAEQRAAGGGVSGTVLYLSWTSRGVGARECRDRRGPGSLRVHRRGFRVGHPADLRALLATGPRHRSSCPASWRGLPSGPSSRVTDRCRAPSSSTSSSAGSGTTASRSVPSASSRRSPDTTQAGGHGTARTCRPWGQLGHHGWTRVSRTTRYAA
jgi:hypothetical protein